MGMPPYEKDFVTFLIVEEAHVKVLRNIALNGISTKYSVKKRLKGTKNELSHGTIFNAFNKLLQKGYIHEVRRKKGRNPNVDTVYYTVTFKGLSVVFHNLSHHNKYIKEYDGKILPERYASFLPLIFGNWKKIKDKGLEKFAQDWLETIFLNFPKPEEVNYLFFRGPPPADLETFNNWAEFIRETKEITQDVIETIKEEIETLEKDLKHNQEFLQAITN
jgi:DNA-binding PadR family transcriptional regulator